MMWEKIVKQSGKESLFCPHKARLLPTLLPTFRAAYCPPEEQHLNLKPQKSKLPAAAKLFPMQNWANICPSTLATASAVRSGPGSGYSRQRSRRRIYFKVHKGSTMQLEEGAGPGNSWYQTKGKMQKTFHLAFVIKKFLKLPKININNKPQLTVAPSSWQWSFACSCCFC